MLKKKLKKAVSIFQWLLTVVLVSVVLLLIFTAFNPIKSFQIFLVLSGSMEPKIKVGSVVFVQKVKPEILKEGNIITFTSREDSNISITHRLIATEEKEGQTVFKTRGDANNSDDITETLPGQIKGKVVFSLPFLGYLSVWIRKPLGFGLLVILPALLIIISEILNIKKAIEKEVEKKYAEPEKQQKSKSIDSLFIFFLLGIGLFQIKPTTAYFSDVVVVGGNTFSMASDWTTPPPPVAGSVVINEVMWMGSTKSSADEWIELRNMTSSSVDVGKWTIENAKGSGTRTVQLPNGVKSIIPANGYLLISNYPETSANSALNVSVDVVENLSLLNSGNGNLILKDNGGNIIDQAKGDIWPTGFSDGTSAGLHKSMERNDVLGDGLLAANWHTCEVTGCTSGTFWDTAGGNNYGTPKAANLSENDSTSPDYVAPTVTPTPTPELTPTPSPTPEASPTPTPTAEPSPTPVPSTTPSPSPSPEPSSTAEPPANEPPKEPQVEEPPQNQTPLPEEGSEINE